MFDKSLKLFTVILKRIPGSPIPNSVLPKGFSFVNYQDGDAFAWGEIEKSAGTIERTKEAVTYFEEEFVPFELLVIKITRFLRPPA